MSNKPDFTTMTSHELLTYVLDHREDKEALYAYIDKRHAENPNAREYEPGEDGGMAIEEYIREKGLRLDR